MSTKSNLEVTIANGPEEHDEVYRFRYRILVEHGGGRYASADQHTKQLTDVADKVAIHVCIRQRGNIAAALRVIVAPVEKLPAYIRRRYCLDPFTEIEGLTVSLTDYLVVDTEALDSKAANLLMTAAFKLACAKGSGFDFTNASTGEVAVFERLGYRKYGVNYQDSDFGMRVPMVLPTGDIQHLVQVGSPFQRIAESSGEFADLVQWFQRTFPDANNQIQPAAMDDKTLWAYLSRRLDQTPTHRVPLLLSLDHREALRFLKMATVIKCRAGDRIVSKGEIGNEMFVILEGSVEVNDEGQKLAGFGQGGIFGEMAYLNAEPRTADVIASEPTEVLVLTQDTMITAMKKMPEVAARVLFNLSLILTERLRDTSRKYVKAKKLAA